MVKPAAEPDADPLRHARDRARAPLAAGLGVGGATIALGYLFGLIEGPLIAVVGAFGLMTVGRALGFPPREAAYACAAFVLVASAWGIGALRWSSLLLEDVRGAQAVLGPTLLVGSTEVVAGAALAATGAILGLALWASTPRAAGRGALTIRSLQVAPAALATLTIFWGSGVLDPTGVAIWVLGTLLVSVAAVGGAWWFGMTRLLQPIALALGVAATATGGVLVGRGL